MWKHAKLLQPARWQPSTPHNSSQRKPSLPKQARLHIVSKAASKANYYERLGVPIDASEDEIKAAFRRKARQLHPDVNKQADAAEQFIEVKRAYNTLSDPDLREQYRRSLLSSMGMYTSKETKYQRQQREAAEARAAAREQARQAQWYADMARKGAQEVQRKAEEARRAAQQAAEEARAQADATAKRAAEVARQQAQEAEFLAARESRRAAKDASKAAVRAARRAARGARRAATEARMNAQILEREAAAAAMWASMRGMGANRPAGAAPQDYDYDDDDDEDDDGDSPGGRWY